MSSTQRDITFLVWKIMAKQRYINTKFWSDNFISELNPLDRYLFLYFLTNEHTNIAGIYELPLKTISFETGIELDMLKKMLKRLLGKVMYVDGWVCIKNFQKHQSTTSEKVQKGIEIEMSKIPLKVKEKLEKGYPMDTLSNPIIYSNTNSNVDSNSNDSEQSSQVSPLIDLFKVVNPSYKKFFANKTQRSACQRMLETHGFEKLEKIISFLPKSNTTKYMPVVTTPVQLEDKMGQLASAWQKLKNNEAIIL